MEMFSSFFSALQDFVSELTESSSESLSTIELGEYLVLISRIPEITSDLVIIIDSEDLKEAQKMIPKIVKIIIGHDDLFLNWDQEPEELEMFDSRIIKLILSNKKLISESSLTANQSSILKSIWVQKGALSEQLRQNLLNEREELNASYLAEENYIKKFEISNKLIEISEKLRDDEKFIEYQTEANSLRAEIKDRRLRLKYYLDMVMESLRLSKYAETYSYLYSFCLKLMNFAKPEVIDKYKAIAKTILNRNGVSNVEFRRALREILTIEDEINKILTLKV
ncbi:MAG: hypothetical protein ACFFA0_02030 [Promethearchaeota archaeon]